MFDLLIAAALSLLSFLIFLCQIKPSAVRSEQFNKYSQNIGRIYCWPGTMIEGWMWFSQPWNTRILFKHFSLLSENRKGWQLSNMIINFLRYFFKNHIVTCKSITLNLQYGFIKFSQEQLNPDLANTMSVWRQISFLCQDSNKNKRFETTKLDLVSISK